MTHALLWDGVHHTLEVVTVDEMLSRNRLAYTEDVAVYPVPVLMGSEADMRAAAASCSHTILARRNAAMKARARLGRVSRRLSPEKP